MHYSYKFFTFLLLLLLKCSADETGKSSSVSLNGSSCPHALFLGFQAKDNALEFVLLKPGNCGWATKSRTSTQETSVCVPWETIISINFFPLTGPSCFF